MGKMNTNLGKYKIGKIPIHLIIIGLIGLILLIAGNPFTVDEEKEKIKEKEKDVFSEITDPSPYDSDKTRFRKELEKSLSQTLSEVKGVGQVSVMLQLEGGEKIEVAQEQERDIEKIKETDAGGGTRVIKEEVTADEYKMIREGGEDKPLVLRKLKPEISGVLIVAEGGENVKVKERITSAVQGLLNVPPYKIKVLPQLKSQGDFN